jgi:hypothetical protein
MVSIQLWGYLNLTPNDLVNSQETAWKCLASNVECSFSIIGLQLERTFPIWVYHLVMTNIAMERSTMLLRTVNHLFRLGPS